MKVLVIKMSSMGDVIHTMPAITDALRARPGLVIDWCVEASFAPLVRLHPGIRTIHEIHLRHWKRHLLSAQTWRDAATLWRALRGERYDLVIDAQGLIKSAIVASVVGSPISGLDGASAREPLASRIYRYRHAISRNLHAIERIRLLFGVVLDYPPDLGVIDYGIASSSDISTKSILLLHGTSWPSKRWSTKNWIELAQRLIKLGYTPQVTYGNDEEEIVARAIASGAPGTELIPRSSMGEIAEVIRRAAAVVGCDSGLTHLAAAFERPTVALFFSSRPNLTGTIGRRTRNLKTTIDCAPCQRHRCSRVSDEELRPCALALEPSVVEKNIVDLL